MQNNSISTDRNIILFVDTNIYRVYSFLTTYLNQKTKLFDRFIFIYNEEDLDFENMVNHRFLFRASEVAIDQIFYFLCHSDKFRIKGKRGHVTRMVQFQEHQGSGSHLFQKSWNIYYKVLW